MLCLVSNFLLHEMSLKKKALFQKDTLEKCCAVLKSYWWHMEKIIIHWEIMSQNPKDYVQSLNKNNVKLSDIRELWKEKRYSEENIVLIHWQMLQLLTLAVPVQQVSQKRQFHQGRQTYYLFSLSYSTDILILVFWANCFF